MGDEGGVAVGGPPVVVGSGSPVVAGSGLPMVAVDGFAVTAGSGSPVIATAGLPVTATGGLPVIAAAGLPVIATAGLPVAAAGGLPVAAAGGLPVGAESRLPVGAAGGLPVGAGSGLPVVFVHGLRTSRTMWRAQLAAVRAAGHRAVAIDLPGHGERLGEPFTLDGAVASVRTAIDEAGGRALVVGLSLGGYVGIAHAARHPEQVAGLVAAACCTRPHALVVGAWEAASRGILRLPDRGAGLNGLAVRLALPAEGARDVAAGGYAFDVMTQALRAMSGADVLGDLRRVQAPVWLVNGRYDHFRGEERAFLAACRDGRLVVVPGATHLVSLVRPTRFSRAVLEALDVVDAQERAAGGVTVPGGAGRTGRRSDAGKARR